MLIQLSEVSDQEKTLENEQNEIIKRHDSLRQQLNDEYQKILEDIKRDKAASFNFEYTNP